MDLRLGSEAGIWKVPSTTMSPTFIPIEASPSKIMVKPLFCAWYSPFLVPLVPDRIRLISYLTNRVRIFNAQNELATRSFCEQVIVKSCPERSEMQVTCRGWCKPCPRWEVWQSLRWTFFGYFLLQKCR